MATKTEQPQNNGGQEPKKVSVKIGDRIVELETNADGTVEIPNNLAPLVGESSKVIDKSIEVADKASNDTMTLQDGDPSVADKFRGLPMSELIGAPLFAAADAQQRLAGIAWDFYQKIAYDTVKGKDGKEEKVTRILDFDLERPVVQDGVVGETLHQTVKAPFIGLVPIPSLLIDRVDVDFQMEVTDTNVSKSTVTTDTSASASGKWFGITASVSGKVSTSRENTRTTNQTAKYQVHVTASQQRPTEGLSKLMDIMASCIEPVGDNGGGGK